MGERCKCAAKGHCEGEGEEDEIMNDGDSLENVRAEIGDGEVGEKEGKREVQEDGDGEEKWG